MTLSGRMQPCTGNTSRGHWAESRENRRTTDGPGAGAGHVSHTAQGSEKHSDLADRAGDRADSHGAFFRKDEVFSAFHHHTPSLIP